MPVADNIIFKGFEPTDAFITVGEKLWGSMDEVFNFSGEKL